VMKSVKCFEYMVIKLLIGTRQIAGPLPGQVYKLSEFRLSHGFRFRPHNHLFFVGQEMKSFLELCSKKIADRTVFIAIFENYVCLACVMTRLSYHLLQNRFRPDLRGDIFWIQGFLGK
jgi:hypothetical protein